MTTEDADAKLSSLMRSAQAGDQAAYSELLRLSLPIITRVVRAQRFVDLETADIVQDALLSLHSVRHTYDPNRPFTPWLASIVRHRLVDAHRRRVRINKNESTGSEIPETFSDDQTNWNEGGTGDPDLLRRAIADLPAGQRKAVELLKLKEMSLKEASAASGMSIAALKVAVHRGLKALRYRLAGQASEIDEPSE